MRCHVESHEPLQERLRCFVVAEQCVSVHIISAQCGLRTTFFASLMYCRTNVDKNTYYRYMICFNWSLTHSGFGIDVTSDFSNSLNTYWLISTNRWKWINRWILSKKCKTFSSSSLSNVRIYCFSLSHLLVNWICLCFGLFVYRNEPH